MTLRHVFLLIFLAVLVSMPPVSAADYNFYKCSDNSSLGTSYNITFDTARSDTSVCVNSSGVSSTNLAINVSGYGRVEYTGFNFSVAGQTITPIGITWNGSSFQVIDYNSLTVYEYNTSGIYTGFNFSVAGQDTDPEGITWNGSSYFVLGSDNLTIYEYNASGIYTGFNFSVAGQDTYATGITWNGSSFTVIGYNSLTIYEYNASGIYTGFNFSVAGQDTGPEGITSKGSSYFVLGSDNLTIYEYNASGIYTGFNFSVAGQGIFVSGITWNGSSFTVTDYNSISVYEYSYIYLSNLTLDLTNNSVTDWSMTGELNSTNSPQWTSGISSGAFTPGGMIILNITSDTAGILELSGINWGPWITASAPVNDYTTTNTSAILTCTATDPDNATLNYYFYWNGTIIESNTNGTFTFTHADIEQMQNWTINISDEMSANVTTSTRNITIDYTHINLYDENLGTHRTDNGSIFFLNFNYQTVNHTTGNNITLKNLDANIGQKIIIREWNASSTNYPYLRELVSISYTAGEDFDIYSPSTSDLVVHPKLTLNDVTGDFPANITILRIKRYINDILVIIHEGTFGVDKSVAAYLISDIPYQISVDNGDEVRENGEYTPYGSDTTPVYIGPVTYAPGTSLYDVISWNITEGSIKVNYYDASGGTTAISIIMYNDTNRSQILVDCTSTVSTYSCTYAPPGNMSVFINITASTGYGSYQASKVHRYWDAAINFDVGLLESWHYTVMSLILIFGVFLLFNEMHSGIGAIAGVAVTGMCRFFGWITISAPIMAVLVLFAVFVVMVRRKP